MNATPPVFQAQRSSEAIQSNPSASAGSQATPANSQDFAGALNEAGKPARKAIASKPHDANSGGSQLPPSGNRTPSASAPPPPAGTDAIPTPKTKTAGNVPGQSGMAGSSATGGAGAIGAAAGLPGAVAGLPGAAAGLPGAAAGLPGAAAGLPGAVAGLLTSTAPARLPGDTSGVSPNGQPVASASPPINLPLGTVPPADGATPHITGNQAPTNAGSAIPPAAIPPAAMAPAAMAPTLGAAAAPAPPAHVAPTAANVVFATRPAEGAAARAATTGAAAAPTSTDGSTAAPAATPGGGPASADTGAAAQALLAAAIAQGTSAPPDFAFKPDNSATSDTGPAPPGAGGPNASPVLAMAASATHASTSSSAVAAATAASIAQAISASADAGAADRHAHGSGTDFSLSGTSNDGTAGAAQLLTSGGSAASTDISSTPTLKVAAGVDTAEFGQGVADRVSLMVDSNLTSAKLQVNPPALGPIEVRIALQGGHAQVWFSSHSAVTRDALESSSPKLREMLGAQGFGQVSVDISQRSFQERSPPSRGYEGTSAGGSESSVSVQAPSAVSRTASALLDAYA